jgi:hypothetical protein
VTRPRDGRVEVGRRRPHVRLERSRARARRAPQEHDDEARDGRSGLPDPGPAEVTVEVAKTDQTAPGQDVPGSDEAPGAVVDYEGLV